MSLKDWIHRRKLRKIWRNPPEIWTSVGGERVKVSEGARRAAAMNMRENPNLRLEIEKMIGEATARVRYPEAFLDEN